MARDVLFANSHDGSTAIRVRRTGIRAVCRNTFTLALGGRPSGADLRLRHAVGVDTLRDEMQLLHDRRVSRRSAPRVVRKDLLEPGR